MLRLSVVQCVYVMLTMTFGIGNWSMIESLQYIYNTNRVVYSGGFRNLERGVQSEKFWIATPTSGHVGSPI